MLGEGPRAAICWGGGQEPPYAGGGVYSCHTLGEGPRAAIRWGRGLEPPYAGGGGQEPPYAGGGA